MLEKTCFILILGLGAITSTSAQVCPPAEELTPCQCDEARSMLYCYGANSPDINLKAIFERVSPLVGDNVIFEDLRITSLPPSYTQLPADTITTLKFRRITIEYNAALEFIHPNAFNATYGVTTYLSVGSNNLSNSHNNTTDNFNFFNKFQQLEELRIREWGLEYIPNEPFVDLPKLHTLRLYIYGLVGCGSRILGNLPNLQVAQISYNNMTLDGFPEDAFEGIGPNVDLNLENNPMSSLPEALFRPVLDTATRLRIGGEECTGIGLCYKLRLDCDQRIGWLCRNQYEYEPKLMGYLCQTGLAYDVWNWCRDNRRD